MLSIIVAQSENRIIGSQGQLPWRLSADLRRFKRLTMGHHLVMGRKTFESIGRLLPGRTTVILSRNQQFAIPPGALHYRDLREALRVIDDSEVFIVGGGEIYRQALPLAERLYVTLVHANIDGDTSFPELDPAIWREVSTERHAADERNQYDYSFLIYERRRSDSEPGSVESGSVESGSTESGSTESMFSGRQPANHEE